MSGPAGRKKNAHRDERSWETAIQGGSGPGLGLYLGQLEATTYDSGYHQYLKIALDVKAVMQINGLYQDRELRDLAPGSILLLAA